MNIAASLVAVAFITGGVLIAFIFRGDNGGFIGILVGFLGLIVTNVVQLSNQDILKRSISNVHTDVRDVRNNITTSGNTTTGNDNVIEVRDNVDKHTKPEP